MIEADSVHSTPPTNSPIDTISVVSSIVVAVASVASVGTLAAVAIPTGAADTAACAADPIFAAIEAHREADAAHLAAWALAMSTGWVRLRAT